MLIRMLALSMLFTTYVTVVEGQGLDMSYEAVTPDDTLQHSDISQLSKRSLVDVTREKNFDGAVIVTLRTIGPSHDSDERPEFPREDMTIRIQGAKGVGVFESELLWKDTGEKTLEGKPTYIARFLIHPDMKDGLFLTESTDELGGETVGMVTFHSLFKK